MNSANYLIHISKPSELSESGQRTGAFWLDFSVCIIFVIVWFCFLDAFKWEANGDIVPL